MNGNVSIHGYDLAMTTQPACPEPRIPLRLAPYPPELKIIENTAFSEYSKLEPRNLRMTLAHHPKLANAFQNLAHVVLFQTEVGARDREIAIIRTSALSRSEYVWGMHVEIYGESCGLTEAGNSGPRVEIVLARSHRGRVDRIGASHCAICR